MKTDELRDIADIPYFAFSPGIISWSIFCTVSLLSLVLLVYFLRRSNKYKSNSAFTEAIQILDNVIRSFGTGSNIAIKELVTRATLIVKRLLSRFENPAFSSASIKDIENLSGESKNQELKAICQVLVSLENLKYQPFENPSESLQILNELRNKVVKYRESKLVSDLALGK